VFEKKIDKMLYCCHDKLVGGHLGPKRTTTKVLDDGFFWPTNFKGAYNFVFNGEICQKVGGNITKRNEMPMQPLIFYEIFMYGELILWDLFPIQSDFCIYHFLLIICLGGPRERLQRTMNLKLC